MNEISIAVAIATTGRPEVLSQTLAELARQSRLPDRVAVCPAKPGDFDAQGATGLPFQVEVVKSPDIGLTIQRNALIRSLEDVEVIIFFDDDFFPNINFIQQCFDIFSRNEDIVVATGKVLADGATGPGISPDEARTIIANDMAANPLDKLSETLGPASNGYGCNMALRASVIRREHLRFDESLPLYGWQEDVDFCIALSRYGRQVRSERCRGVHLATKGGRNSGVKFGYSQIANPVHIWRKGNMQAGRAVVQITRNIASNFVRSAWPEPWVDRRGRLRGNFLAAADLIRGRLTPQNIKQLS